MRPLTTTHSTAFSATFQWLRRCLCIGALRSSLVTANGVTVRFHPVFSTSDDPGGV